MSEERYKAALSFIAAKGCARLAETGSVCKTTLCLPCFAAVVLKGAEPGVLPGHLPEERIVEVRLSSKTEGRYGYKDCHVEIDPPFPIPDQIIEADELDVVIQFFLQARAWRDARRAREKPL
jgi:hypothetical protein